MLANISVPMPWRTTTATRGTCRQISQTPGKANCANLAQQQSWRAVWCDERCHKQDNVEQRNSFETAALNNGASLIGLKKAAKFASWIAQGSPSPYILIASWREIKPCIDSVKQHAPEKQPVLIIVLCGGRKQFERASCWAQFQAPGYVFVCRGIDCARDFFLWMAQQVAARSKKASHGAMVWKEESWKNRWVWEDAGPEQNVLKREQTPVTHLRHETEEVPNPATLPSPSENHLFLYPEDACLRRDSEGLHDSCTAPQWLGGMPTAPEFFNAEPWEIAGPAWPNGCMILEEAVQSI